MNGLKHYLLSKGLLNSNASKEEIELAKAQYARLYNIEYQKKYASRMKKLNVCLSPKEYKLIQESAKRHNQKGTTHLKSLAFAYFNQEFIIPNLDILQSLNLQIRGIAVNINQLSKKVNTYGNAHFNRNELLQNLKAMEDLIWETMSNPKPKNHREKIKDILSSNENQCI